MLNSWLHVFNPVIAVVFLLFYFPFLKLLSFFPLATETKTHWGCVKPLAVNCQEQCESPVGTMWFLNCLLRAVFSESLPAAPRPLMAPRARSAVSTVAKSRLSFFPARSRGAFSAIVKQTTKGSPCCESPTTAFTSELTESDIGHG